MSFLLHAFQGDTLQNVANELERIIETGLYIFTLSSAASVGVDSMTLEYMPSARPTLSQPSSNTEDGVGQPRTLTSSGSFQETVGGGNGTQLVSRKESWTREQINDFVRKLGFLDTQREGGDQIKHFLHINEVHILSICYNYVRLSIQLLNLLLESLIIYNEENQYNCW